MMEALAAREPKDVLVRYSLGLAYALLGAIQRELNLTASVQAYGKAIAFRQELIQSYVQDQASSGLCSSFLWTVYPAISSLRFKLGARKSPCRDIAPLTRTGAA